MGGEPLGDVTHAESHELDALRRRAYGPDADIFGDSAAVARLNRLEDRARQDRFPAEHDPMNPQLSGLDAESATPTAGPHPGASPAAVVVDSTPARRSAPRWHAGLLIGTAAVASLLGGAAWSEGRPSPADTVAAEQKTSTAADDRYAEGHAADYRTYMEGLRDDVLSLPGGEGVADRMIRDQLKPYGILYGRTVGAGPTVDHRFCMIIADLPAASITCIPVEYAYANPVSVQLPAWYSDSESDMFTGLGELVSYTLMPGGGVVAEPADFAGSAGTTPFADSAAPTPTAVPPPGWQ